MSLQQVFADHLALVNDANDSKKSEATAQKLAKATRAIRVKKGVGTTLVYRQLKACSIKFGFLGLHDFNDKLDVKKMNDVFKQLDRGAGKKYHAALLCWMWLYHPSEAKAFYDENKIPEPKLGISLLENWERNQNEICSSVRGSLERLYRVIAPLQADHVTHEIESQFFDHLKTATKGFWALTAGPGMGKSAIFASITKRIVEPHICLPYFFKVNGARHESNSQKGLYKHFIDCLRYVYPNGEDIIQESINKSIIEETSKKDGIEARRFWSILHKLSDAGLISKDRKLILVIDALDENNASFDPTINPNPMFFPDPLPDGVIVAFSVRLNAQIDLTQLYGDHDFSYAKLDILQNDPDAITAQKRTVERFAARECEDNATIVPYHGKASERTPSDEDRDEFIEGLCKAAGWNFMLLKLALREENAFPSYTSKFSLGSTLDDYYRGHLKRMELQNPNSDAPRSVFCFALRDERKLSRISYRRLTGADSEASDDSNATSLMKQWVHQGLFLASTTSGNVWYEPYHETYQTHLALTFSKLGRADYLRPYARRYSADIDLAAPTLSTQLDELSAGALDIKEELLELLLKLNAGAFQSRAFQNLMTNAVFWKAAALTERSLFPMINALRAVDFDDAPQDNATSGLKKEFHAAMVDAAKLLQDLIQAGELDGREGKITWDKMKSFAEHASANAGYATYRLDINEPLSFPKIILQLSRKY